MSKYEAVIDILRLHPGLSTQHIAERVGCRREYVRVCRLRAGIDRPQHKLTSWTRPEADLLLRLRDEEKLDWEQIAKRMGRSRSACHSKWTYLTHQVAHIKDAEPKEKMEDAHFQARARRQNAGYRSLAAQFFGDPPIGYSALDGRPA